MKNIFYLILCFVILFLTVVSCKKTEKDIEWENKLKGFKWEAIDKNNNKMFNIPIFVFEDNNDGYSYLNEQQEIIDKFGWEIRKKELRLFYDKAPKNYVIGQDKYNSKAIFIIKSFKTDDKVEVSQLTQGDYQLEYSLQKIK